MLSEIAKTIGVASPTADVEAIADRIGSKQTLVVLDNAEHLLDAAKDLAALMRLTPQLRLIVTSRTSLAIAAERIFDVMPMSDDASSTLFLTRARSAGSDMQLSPGVEELCNRLDGLPLAIELAAARTSTFSPQQLVEMIQSQPRLLQGPRDADARHQTLVDTVQWSVDLLPEADRRLFGALSVFGGGCTWQAASDVCDADPASLAALVDNSLLRRTDDDEPRFWMLETIRSVATMELDGSGDAPRLRQGLEEWLIRAIAVQDGRWADHRWATLEVDNLRAAIGSAMAAGRVNHAFSLLSTTWTFWLFTGRADEGERMWKQLLDRKDLLSQEEFVEGISLLAEYARFMGKTERAVELQRQAIELYEFLETGGSLAGTLHDHCETLASLGRFEEAEVAGRRALEIRRRVGDSAGIAHAMESFAALEEYRGTWARALDIRRDSLPLARPHPTLANVIEVGMAIDHLHLDQPEEAFTCLRTVVPRIDLLHDLDLFCEVANVLAYVTEDQGQEVLATRLLGAAEAISHLSGLSPGGLLKPEMLRAKLLAALPEAAFEHEFSLWSACSLDEAHELIMGCLTGPTQHRAG